MATIGELTTLYNELVVKVNAIINNSKSISNLTQQVTLDTSSEIAVNGGKKVTIQQIIDKSIADFDINEIKDAINDNADIIDLHTTEIASLTEGQTGGLKSFTTLALLQAYPTPNVNDSYKVTNDGISSNNGYYHWVSGTTYVKDANLANGLVASGNVDAVSGGTVYDAETERFLDFGKNKFDKSLALPDTYINNGTGVFKSLAPWGCLNYIKVEELTEYTVSNTIKNFENLHFYDVDKVHISEIVAPGAKIKTFTTPANCVYFSAWSILTAGTFDAWRESTQLELGGVATTYEPFTELIKESLLPKSDVAYKLTVIKEDENVYIRSKFNSTKDLVQKFNVFKTDNFSNNVINFNGAWLIDKKAIDTVIIYESGSLLATQTDDACPVSYNGTYIGGNHGCSDLRSVTSTAHGKATADIGSEWTDTLGVKFYIIRIVDANTLWMLSEDSSDTDIWNFNTTITGNLIHSRSATNTGTITVESYVLAQLTPAIKNHVKKVLLDNDIEITTNGTYYTNEINLVDNYDIVNPSSVLDNLRSKVGTNYINDTVLSDAIKVGDSSLSKKINYNIQGNGAIVTLNGWRNYQEIDIGYDGFMQMGTPSTAIYPNLDLYIPKLLPISDGVISRDFRTIEDYDVAPAITLNLTTPFWEVPLSPPERSTEFLSTGTTKNIGISMGYDLVKGIGKARKDLIDNAFFLYTSRKLYPHAIDSKLGNIPLNTWYSCIGYRVFTDATTSNTDKANATNLFYYKVGSDIMVVFDYHTTVDFDNLNLPNEFNGMSITVVEKSANVTIHNDVVLQNGVNVSVGAGTYAYCTLKLT